jgi:hypothetical protein
MTADRRVMFDGRNSMSWPFTALRTESCASQPRRIATVGLSPLVPEHYQKEKMKIFCFEEISSETDRLSSVLALSLEIDQISKSGGLERPKLFVSILSYSNMFCLFHQQKISIRRVIYGVKDSLLPLTAREKVQTITPTKL